ncbi:hypothetical protein GP486_004539 [Trichoglossum hirsutum]|uniref:NACHT-NTPase and P-loop NTPases N-terminal domain-containing protein n=1 Tax=Trichoglossum hirsutum TaxID=265104 RepID=A0A9P8RPJ3_9PEZI|nr:hypothetical protein GP486_004539 [Trichoglossum hirsutum]
MAEISVIRLVSSITQLVIFGSKVVSRLHEFQSSVNEVPKTFRDIMIQLPLVIDTLKQTERQADAGHVGEETAKALRPVVDECLSQIKLLEDILAKAMPAKEDSDWKRRFKALSSFAHDGDVQKITASLERYVQTLTYYQASQRFEPILEIPRRKTCFMVRFDQDPNFIGREDTIKEIGERFKMRQRRVAVAGIGGVGKSQIAIEYCYRYRDSHPEANVFWVHASNYARFKEEYKNIARELSLPGIDDPDVDTLQLVSKWLSDDINGPWLLVLDNADDMEILFGSNSPTSPQQKIQGPATTLASYLPRSPNGSIIITTRDRRVGERLANRQKPISVLPFMTADAEKLLRCKTLESDEWDRVESIELLEALGYLPLAITQAAAFVSENDITITEYLEMLRAGNSDTEDILEEDLLDPGRDPEIRNSVFQTWRLSFDQIRRQKPRAAEILSLMAVLDRQAISDALLRNDDERNVEFITAVGTLKAFSLITEERKGAIFGMHRLVQFSTQMWLKSKHELIKWQEKALEVVSKHCPSNGEYENWASWRAVNPHVQAVLGYDLQTECCLLQRAAILNGKGWYDRAQVRYSAAYDNMIEALAIREKILGPDNALTLDTAYNLGNLYLDQDKLTEAETMYERALAGKERILGPDHSSTLETVNSLGNLYGHQDRPGEAEMMHKRALAGFEKALGLDHTSTLRTVNDLANFYLYRDKLDEAEALYKRALAEFEEALGLDYMSMRGTVNGLGNLYMRRGRLGEAETMYKRALIGEEKALGPDHTSTLTTVHCLGALYHHQENLGEAEVMYKRALAGYKKALGSDHTWTLTTVHCLGDLYRCQEKFNEAEAMYKWALVGFEKALGSDHTWTLTTVYCQGNLYYRQEKLNKAEVMYKRALAGFEKALGPDHTTTLATVNSLGGLYSRQNKFDKTEAMYERALAGYENALGPNHTWTLATAECLGMLFQSQGQLDKAEAMFKRALPR